MDVINEGAFAQLSCVVTEGDEPLAISWSIHGHSLTSDLGIVTSNMGARASILMIPAVDHKHMGDYTCSAKNRAGDATHTASLKVNGRRRSLDRSCGRSWNHRKAWIFLS